MNRLTRDGTAEPVSRDQILRHAREQGNIHFPCSADHEREWQPYPVDPYSAICDDHTYIYIYIYIHIYVLPCVVCVVCFLPIHSGHQVRWTYQPGSHRSHTGSLDVPAGVTQEEGHTRFLIHLPSAVRALIFVARRIQPFLSLVDREVEFCVLTN